MTLSSFAKNQPPAGACGAAVLVLLQQQFQGYTLAESLAPPATCDWCFATATGQDHPGHQRGAMKEIAVCSPMCADACTLFCHFSRGLPMTWMFFCWASSRLSSEARRLAHPASMATEGALILPLCVQVLLFCHSAKTLNTMEQLMLRVVYNYVRLDGAPVQNDNPDACAMLARAATSL